MIANTPNTRLHSPSRSGKNVKLKKALFIPSFAFSIAQLCKIKRRTTAIYRLADVKRTKREQA